MWLHFFFGFCVNVFESGVMNLCNRICFSIGIGFFCLNRSMLQSSFVMGREGKLCLGMGREMFQVLLGLKDELGSLL